MMERTFFGVRRPQFDDLTDASFVEAVPLVLMVMTIIGIGVWPTLLTDVFESGLNPMVDVLNGVINP
jgi:NADH-quinone oxidoreductase subunit M